METIARELDRAFYAGRGFGINRSLCVLMGFYGKNREEKENSEKNCNDGYEFRRPALTVSLSFQVIVNTKATKSKVLHDCYQSRSVTILMPMP